jgi:ketosteroid isomerase-like protein
MIFEVHDVQVTAGDDVAFATALTRCSGTDDNGEAKAGWMRMTAGYRKMYGKWTIVHEHFSAPFDMETLKVIDVQP